MYEKIEQIMNENLITFADFLEYMEEEIKNNYLLKDNELSTNILKRAFTLDKVTSLLKEKAKNQAKNNFIQSGVSPKFLSIYNSITFEDYKDEKELARKLLELGYTSDDIIVPEKTIPSYLKKATALKKSISEKHFNDVVEPLSNYSKGVSCKLKAD